MTAPSAGDMIGLEFIMNNQNDDRTKSQTWWANTDGGGANSSAGFGDLVFMDDAVGSGINPTKNTLENFRLFPNPVNDVLSISGVNTGSEQYNIEMYNILGGLEYSTTKSVQLPYTLDMSEIQSGIYFIKIKSNSSSQTVTRKVVKQ